MPAALSSRPPFRSGGLPIPTTRRLPLCVVAYRSKGRPAIEVLDPTPKYLRNKRLPWKPIHIMPLGDVQFGSPGTDLPKLQQYIEDGLRHDAWFLGMGDFHDVLSPSNRKRLMSASLYDNAYDFLEEMYMRHLEELKAVLAPTKDRWLGMLEGHHFFEFSDGSTTDTELCRFLGAPFLGSCGFLRLTFLKEKANQSCHCDIWCHHGQGGGSTVGAILNKLERIAGSFSSDLYFMGHANRLSASPKPLLELSGSKNNIYLKNRDRYLVATGAFDRGYQVHSTAGKTGRPRGGYVEQAAMLPTGLGAPLVSIEPMVVDDRHGETRMNYTELRIRVTV